MKAIVRFQRSGNGGFYHIGLVDDDTGMIFSFLSGSDPNLRKRFCGETGKEDAQKFADKINNNELENKY